MTNPIGKPTVHPLLFYFGKMAGYFSWGAYLMYLFVFTSRRPPSQWLELLAHALAGLGLAVTLVSMINLGRSTRLGLPLEDTKFKTNGLYRFSRNPMYLGFDLMTLAAMIFTWNPAVLALALFSITVYHLIILGEEKFLEQRFGDEYRDYRKRVGRYI